MSATTDRIRRKFNLCRMALTVVIFSNSVMTMGQATPKIHLRKGSMSRVAIFREITRQVNIGVEYSQVKLDTSERIDISDTVMTLDQLLRKCLEPLNIIYVPVDGNIYLRMKPGSAVREGEGMEIILMVSNMQGERLEGATVRVPGPRNDTIMYSTNRNGMVSFHVKRKEVNLRVTHVGYQQEKVYVDKSGLMEVHMKVSVLDNANVKGYTTGTRRTSTGNIGFLDQAGADRMQVPDINSFLAGKTAGLLVTTTSGWAGASGDVSLRGRNSILNRGGPLYLVDGVPYTFANLSFSHSPSGNAGGSLSPLNFISLDAIDSIEVLKDADATAIYGSRGANGVILISTRRGIQDRCHMEVNIGSGWSEVTRHPALMDTRQYTAMRLEAIRNDGDTTNNQNAGDLVTWDTTRRTDWGKWLLGHRGSITHANIDLYGGNRNLRYFLGGSHLWETSIFPTHPVHSAQSIFGSLAYLSPGRRLEATVTGVAGNDHNQQFITDPTQAQYLAPNAPPLYDSSGHLQFGKDGVFYLNPMYFIGNTYDAASTHLLLSGNARWQPFHFPLQLRITGGISKAGTDEFSAMPKWNQDPAFNPTGTAYEAHSAYRSWITEPQLSYVFRRKGWTVDALAGYSWQGTRNVLTSFTALGFTSDSLLHQPSFADTVLRDKPQILDYRYQSLLGRVNINWRNTYILNVTGRRDVNTQFKGARQNGYFGAAGVAWVFSEAAWSRQWAPVLSYGKLRGSYGVTGNDLVSGNNHYLDSWSPASAIIAQNAPSGYSTGPLSPDASWEVIRKLEVALELGWLDNRYTFTVDWYRHRSDHQLLPDSLPSPGNPIHLRNLPVVLQNSGWEFCVTAKPVRDSRLEWTVLANISLPVSRLVRFDGLAASPFREDLMVGRSLNALKAYRYTGVDPNMGIYRFTDFNKDGRIDAGDRVYGGSLDVTCFGGVENILRWRRWRLQALVEGRVQQGIKYETAIFAADYPGVNLYGYSNQPAYLARRWYHPGDRAPYQRVSASTTGPVADALQQWLGSDAVLTNASFIRLRTVALSYEWPADALKKLRLQGIKVSLQAQNLLTLTPFQGGDPEVQSAVILPPLRTVMAGVQVKF